MSQQPFQAAPGQVPADGLTLLARAIADLGGGQGDLLGGAVGDEESVRFGGSRGAVAFARERARFERAPKEALLAVDAAGREMCGIRAGQAFRLEDAVLELPLGTFLTKKRAGFLFGNIGEAMLQEKWDLAMGLVAQALRWISLSLTLKDEEAAWKVTYLRDPKDVETPKQPARPDLMSCHLQDVRQLTALCGLLKDEEALGFRLRRAGGNPKKPEKTL